MDNYSFDDAKFYLGKLCRNEHEWEGSGQSLRYLNGEQRCLVCQKGRTKRRYQKLDIDKERIRKRENYHANLERSREVKRRNAKKFRENNPGKVFEAKEKYRLWSKTEAGRLSYQRRHLKRLTTLKGKLLSKININKRKARKASVHNAPYSTEDIQALLQKFGNSCAYCGSTSNLSLDHVIPISKGGCNTLGNLLPACISCNSSKHNRDIDKWYKSREFYNQTKWRKIQRHLGKEVCNGQLTLF